MIRLLLYFVKCLNHLTNEKPTADQAAKIILKYLLFKSDTKYTLEVSKSLNRLLKEEMLRVRDEYSDICLKIDETYPEEPVKIIHQLGKSI